MRMRLLGTAVTALLAMTVASCGSSSKAPTSPGGANQKTPSISTSTNAAPTPTCTIPQNNGGDHDADNNGGPNDGDGCDV